MLRKITILIICFAISTSLSAQIIKTGKNKAILGKKGIHVMKKTKYKKLPSGLEYMFIQDIQGTKQASIGANTQIHIITRVGDSVVFDSYKLNHGQPVPAPVTKPQFNGDLNEGFALMSEGDHAIFKALTDSVYRDAVQRPSFTKPGDYIYFDVTMVLVQTAQEIKKQRDEAIAKESVLIEDYLKKNKLQAKRTASGLYYIMTKKGTGPTAQNGQTVSMNYTGYLLDGTVFDSNILPKFGHVQPFDFPLGQGRVIKGWDEGIAKLNKGAKAKLIIPSSLAYGTRAQPGNANNEKGIPANSILIFDVEMLGTK